MKYTRSKSALFLIELIIAVLFFSIASAVCMQLFAHAHVLSERSAALDSAMLTLESCAEVYAANGADLESASALVQGEATTSGFCAFYTRTFEPCAQEKAYYVFFAQESRDANGVFSLALSVLPTNGGEPLFEITKSVYSPAL